MALQQRSACHLAPSCRRTERIATAERCHPPVHRTVSDFAVGDNLLGLIVAAMSVVSSGMQQIFCRSMQQKHKLSSHELLSNTAPAQVRTCQSLTLQHMELNTPCSMPCALQLAAHHR